MKEITDSNFTIPSEGVVLIDFWAAWCAPCRMLAPVLNKISGLMPEVQFYKIDVEDYRELAMKLAVNEITALPTIVIYTNGKVFTTMKGFRSEAVLIEELNKATKSLTGV